MFGDRWFQVVAWARGGRSLVRYLLTISHCPESSADPTCISVLVQLFHLRNRTWARRICNGRDRPSGSSSPLVLLSFGALLRISCHAQSCKRLFFCVSATSHATTCFPPARQGEQILILPVQVANKKLITNYHGVPLFLRAPYIAPGSGLPFLADSGVSCPALRSPGKGDGLLNVRQPWHQGMRLGPEEEGAQRAQHGSVKKYA